MPLLALPTELVLDVGSNLSLQELSTFLKSNRHLHHILNHSLYATAARSSTTIRLCNGSDITGSFLHLAAATTNLHLLENLLSLGAPLESLDSQNTTALDIAIGESNHDMIRRLLQYGADPNTVHGLPGKERSAFSRAIETRQDLSIISLLITHGANVHSLMSSDPDSPPVLHVAVRQRNMSLVRLLLKHGADVNALWKEKAYSPLFMVFEDSRAGTRSHIPEDMIRLLAEFGADLDAQDRSGFAVLHLAVMHSHMFGIPDSPVARVLLELGADWRVKERHGLSAKEFAERARKWLVVEMMEQFGEQREKKVEAEDEG